VGLSGTLTGNGTVWTISDYDAGRTAVVRGTLAPSGTLSIGFANSKNNLILQGSATTVCSVTPSGNDSVEISGTATVDGRLSVTMTGTFTCGTTQYTLLLAGGALTGSFGSVSIKYPTNQGFTPQIAYDYVGNHVYLDLMFNNGCH